MMKKRFSSLMSSFHGSCKSKEEISAAADVLPAILYLSPLNREGVDIDYPPQQQTRRMAAAAAAVVVTSGCRCVRQGRKTRRSVPAIDMGEDDMSRARETPAYLWRKEEKWEVAACSEELARRIRKVDEEEEEEEEEDQVPFTIDLTKSRRTRTRDHRAVHQKPRERKKLFRSKSTISISSRDSTSCCSSGEDDEENDERDDGAEEEEEDDEEEDGDDDHESTNASLLSPLGLASTASYSSSSIVPEARVASASAVGMLKQLVPCAAGGADEGKAQESFAVVKKSEDPRGDFRRSMAEMVAEKGMYDAADLEQLLHCFLSLNSRHHHRAIVSAFSDIWQTLFPENSPNFSNE